MQQLEIDAARRRARSTRVVAGVLLGAALGCSTTPAEAPAAARRAQGVEVPAALRHAPLALERVRTEAEGITVEASWLLDVYTVLHSRDYSASRVVYPSGSGESVVAHLLLPPGPGPHAVVVVFPILGGSHLVSEALAKALVRRGYAVARLERRPLALATAEGPEQLAHTLAAAVRDARRLVDWLESQSTLDPTRIGAAGVSLGGILACLLLAVDDRVRAGFLALAGGGLAEILHDSRERPLRAFRERLAAEGKLGARADFVASVRPALASVEPLRYAPALEPGSVLLVSGYFDRVIPPERTRALWEELGRPRWLRVPSGHYQILPFFWYAAARGADHLDRTLGPPTLPEAPGAPARGD